MLGEDYRSQAMSIMNTVSKLNQTIRHRDETIDEKIQFILYLEQEILGLKETNENSLMYAEDLIQVIV